MSAARSALCVALLFPAAACTATESSPSDPADAPARAELRVELARAEHVSIVGVAAAPRPDSDELPGFALSVASADGALHPLAIEAVGAAVDADALTLAWVDPAGALWVAPLASAPADRRAVAEQALPGLAIARGRLAFAIRIDGPETAPFVADLSTLQLTALDDGPGPDEVMGFSPNGDEVLLLSGRTGLASLFAVGVDQPAVRQLTNIGLAPGPDLDTTAVAPTPIDHRGVAWGRRGIAYRAEDSVILLEPGNAPVRLSTDRTVEEVAQ